MVSSYLQLWESLIESNPDVAFLDMNPALTNDKVDEWSAETTSRLNYVHDIRTVDLMTMLTNMMKTHNDDEFAADGSSVDTAEFLKKFGMSQDIIDKVTAQQTTMGSHIGYVTDTVVTEATRAVNAIKSVAAKVLIDEIRALDKKNEFYGDTACGGDGICVDYTTVDCPQGFSVPKRLLGHQVPLRAH